MIEFRNSSGALDFARITPEIISALDEPRQQSLLALMKAAETKDAAVARKNAATKRVYDAIADEEVKRVAHEDASSPIPFVAPKIENFGTKAQFDAAMHEARTNHALRVRALREADARKAAIDAYNSSH